MGHFGFLSAYGLFDLYMIFQKGAANGHPKVESMANITTFAWTSWRSPPFWIYSNFKLPVVLAETWAN